MARFLALALVASGCTQVAQYTKYDGPLVVRQGTGGFPREVAGVRYWFLGAPAESFKVVGIISGGTSKPETVSDLALHHNSKDLLVVSNDAALEEFLAGAKAWRSPARLTRSSRFVAIRYVTAPAEAPPQ